MLTIATFSIRWIWMCWHAFPPHISEEVCIQRKTTFLLSFPSKKAWQVSSTTSTEAVSGPFSELREATNKCEVIQQIKRYIVDGWPSNPKQVVQAVIPFYLQSTLIPQYYQQYLMFKKMVIVPPVFQRHLFFNSTVDFLEWYVWSQSLETTCLLAWGL